MPTKKHSRKANNPGKTNKKNYTMKKTMKKPMEIEFEGRILDINPDEMREKIKSLGGHMKKGLTLYKRSVFSLCDVKRGFVRVRDEGDKITLTSKIYKNPDFPQEYELQLKDEFEHGQEFLRSLNLTEKAYHETIREKWTIPKPNSKKGTELCEITIDYIPGLPPYSEIECKSKADLMKSCKLLNVRYKDLIFGGYGNVFTHYYDIPNNIINNEIESLTFQNIEKELEKHIRKNAELLHNTAKTNLEVFKTLKNS